MQFIKVKITLDFWLIAERKKKNENSNPQLANV